MTDPRLVDGLEQDDAGLFIRVRWEPGTERGADLPEDYFADIDVGELGEPYGRGYELIASAELSGEREITVRFAETIDRMFLAQERELSFTLAFEDRRKFTSCTHRSIGDRYLLDVIAMFDENGELVDVQLEQDIYLGPV